VSDYQQGRIVAGLRLTSIHMRQHGGREAERRGALRPTVAAAMVMLAGEPAGPHRRRGARLELSLRRWCTGRSRERSSTGTPAGSASTRAHPEERQ
jgi:hypothetical protein